MSGGLAPSKSTVYISNLPFSLKTNDLHKIFEKYGKIVKVTVLKDRDTRKSKGVAFIFFLNKEEALKCVEDTNSKEMFGRTLRASLAKDNGRTSEFIRRKDYPDKSKCYECGEEGHMSYSCNKNLLGTREPPPKKVKKQKRKLPGTDFPQEHTEFMNSSDEESGKNEEEEKLEEDCETLSAAIAAEQEKKDLDLYREKVALGKYEDLSEGVPAKKKKIKQSTYFSDEEESD